MKWRYPVAEPKTLEEFVVYVRDCENICIKISNELMKKVNENYDQWELYWKPGTTITNWKPDCDKTVL